jgi:hypothetical protein
LGGALIFYGHIFILKFSIILTDLSPLNIQFLNLHGDDDGEITLLWFSPVRGLIFIFYCISKIIYGQHRESMGDSSCPIYQGQQIQV